MTATTTAAIALPCTDLAFGTCMSFGGFLGIGEEYHPLPWELLKYDTGLEGYVANLTRETLEEAPRFAIGDEPDWRDRAYGARVHGYYDVPPYWSSL